MADKGVLWAKISWFVKWPGPVLHDNVNHHKNYTCDHHVNTFTLIGSQLVVMVLRAQWPPGTIAQFFHFVAEEKRKTTKKQRPFYNWATTGIQVNSSLTTNHESSLYFWGRRGKYFKITKFQLLQVERYFIILSPHEFLLQTRSIYTHLSGWRENTFSRTKDIQLLVISKQFSCLW